MKKVIFLSISCALISLTTIAQDIVIAKEDVYINKGSYMSNSTGNNLGNLILFGDGSNGGGWQSSIKWSGLDGFNSNISNGSRINAEITVGNVGTYGKADLIFKTKGTNNNATPTEKMRITSSGNIGIGISNPQEKFQISNSYTFHDGGHKVLGFLYKPSGGVDLDSSKYSGEIRFDPTNGNLRLGTSSSITNTPVTSLYIDKNGDIGIGVANTQGYKLGVKGKIAAEEVKVALYNTWPDYVFESNYELKTLEEVENHIKEKGHLPNIPSAKEVEKNGIQLGEMNAKLLQKIEELTLYIIEQNKKTEQLQKEVALLKEKIK